jgi:hypothetical protein
MLEPRMAAARTQAPDSGPHGTGGTAEAADRITVSSQGVLMPETIALWRTSF